MKKVLMFSSVAIAALTAHALPAFPPKFSENPETAKKFYSSRSPASKNLDYAIQCDVSKAKTGDKSEWVKIESKSIPTTPIVGFQNTGKSKPDLSFTADNLKIEYTNISQLVNFVAGTSTLLSLGVLTITNQISSDSITTMVNDQLVLSDQYQAGFLGDASIGYTTGLTADAKVKTDYMIRCFLDAKAK